MHLKTKKVLKTFFVSAHDKITAKQLLLKILVSQLCAGGRIPKYYSFIIPP